MLTCGLPVEMEEKVMPVEMEEKVMPVEKEEKMMPVFPVRVVGVIGVIVVQHVGVERDLELGLHHQEANH